ncbi:hypothetical protein [Acinetobacter sp. Ac_5812]|uniref:hypothetical protein n=1 Tax=Acinetobacter sp. Ac_5812 TaxID=1848937 RepID=UPI00148FDEA3|nr:hypothetical protein [Acinetobacter sp. Ac_5812]NNP67563.1 hypothetical protein [Acinetobacter sp. Ac_5812]
MSKLSPRELVLFRRAAEDAIHACNRHYGPFIDVVAHPLNMLKLVEMAELSNQQQSKVNDLQKRVDDSIFILSTIDTPDEAYSSIDLLLRALRGSAKELEQAIKGKAI